MKYAAKWLACLLSLLLPATASATSTLSGGGGGGIGSSSTAQYQWSGTVVLRVDDGSDWNYDQLLPLMQDINEDFGLTGTAWEMKWTCGVNPRGVNGIQGYQGLPGWVAAMTTSELSQLASSGLCEIASHSQYHGTPSEMDLGSGYRVRGPWPTTALPDSTTYAELRDSFYALRDTLRVGPIYSYVAANHRYGEHAMQVLAKYYKNGSHSDLHYSSAQGEFPNTGGLTNSDTTPIQRGVTLHFNRTNLDNMAYWWYGFNSFYHGFVLPFTPINRMNLPHVAPPINGQFNFELNQEQTKDLFLAAAESKSLIVLVWHDMDNDPPGIGATQNLGGMAGVEEVLRYGASLCANGLLQADGPKVQFLTLNDAVNKKNAALSYVDGAINVVDNFRMLADRESSVDGDGAFERPWGYPDLLAQDAGSTYDVWADSGYKYVDPATCAEAGGWFGYYNDSGIIATPIGAVSDAANFSSLVQVFQVMPGSHARISCYASTSQLPEATPNDSLSAAWINILVTPMRFNNDPTDTVPNFVRTPGTPRMLEQNVEIGEQATSDYVGTGAGSANAYSSTRMQKRFHAHDEWEHLRTTAYSSPWYFTGTAGNAGNDRDMRWRPFHRDYVVPNDAYAIRVEFKPTGWTLSTSDSLAFTGIEVMLTQR